MAGHPRKYQPKDLEEKFIEYINDCVENEKLANITGFCVFAKMNPDTFYNYKNIDGYSETLKNIETILEDFSIQSAYKAKNPAFLIFYMKNKFGWVDKQEINSTIDAKVNNPLKDLSTEEIKKLLKD